MAKYIGENSLAELVTKTKQLVATKQDTLSSGTGINISSNTISLNGVIPYTTTAPTAANTTGLKICVLSSEPATKYSGWLYLIEES